MQKQRTICRLFAAVSALLMVFHIIGAPQGFAADSKGCAAVHAGTSDTHHSTQPLKNCCTGLHCCPITQRAPTTGLPVAIGYRLDHSVRTSAALYLDRSPDPPPKSDLLRRPFNSTGV